MDPSAGDESDRLPLAPVVATGIDVVAIDRMASLRDRYGKSFDRRVFTDEECAYCDDQARPAEHYAARFAAKEAFRKALPDPAPSLPLSAVGVDRHDHGPSLSLGDPALAALENLAPSVDAEDFETAVSLTHDRQTGVAAAQVVLVALTTRDVVDGPRAQSRRPTRVCVHGHASLICLPRDSGDVSRGPRGGRRFLLPLDIAVETMAGDARGRTTSR